MNERRIIECQRKRYENIRSAGEKILVLIRKLHTFFPSMVTKANTVSAGNKSLPFQRRTLWPRAQMAVKMSPV